MAPGCKPGGFTPYAGSNPAPCTSAIANFDFGFRIVWSLHIWVVEVMLRPFAEVESTIRNHNPKSFSGCSSVGRASAFQAEGREFESRRPLQRFHGALGIRARVAQG